MTPEDDHPFLHAQDYQQASADLIALKASLPRDAVVSMAREVLALLARRGSESATQTEAVLRLSRALLSNDPLAAAQEIEAHSKANVSPEALLLGYLGPAARQLGEWWESDHITFADVTVGTGRIYGIMRTLHRHLPVPSAPKDKAALIASVPDETHILGARMATDLLRDQGWTIDLALSLSHEDLLDHIARSGHLVLGLSAAGEHALPALARLVLAVQLRCPQIMIFVGGNIVAESTEHIRLMGVDGMSPNFGEAASILESLWARVSARAL